MEYVRLAFGLLTPWIMGYLWLGALESRFGLAGTAAPLKVGYGLFIGYSALQGLVLAYSGITGSFDFWPIFAAIVVLALAGGLVWRTSGPAGEQLVAPKPTQTHSNQLATVLFWLLLAWTGLHLAFTAIEILHRPLFPWDGWSSWNYRARAWFGLGEIVPLGAPSDWVDGNGDPAYVAPGHHYPTFLPVLTFWSATALGRWSETLINLPTFLCGLAMALGIYGQCRLAGLGRTGAALGAYLLLSIPLIGAHLSLAGQADIWMAGFSGLGTIAIINGCLTDRRDQILLGLAMAAMGIATKIEGSVWFLVAAITLLLVRRTRITLLALASVVLLMALAWLLGVTYLDIPGIGGVGLADGRLHFPMVGDFRQETFSLWDDYRDNFLAGGSWHLLWTLVIVGFTCLWLLPAGALRRSIVAFFVLALAAQSFIFEWTESGHWAEDWTAINRLPLHIAPAVIFLLLLQLKVLAERTQSLPQSRNVLWWPILALALTLAGCVAVLSASAVSGETQRFTARDLGIVVGAGHLDGDLGVIDKYHNNIAIASSGPLHIVAQDVALLRVETSGNNSRPVVVFWRNGQGDPDLHSMALEGRGIHYLDLDEIQEWTGQITELGLLFYRDGDKSMVYHSLRLSGRSIGIQLARTLEDWSNTNYWTQKSVNFIPAGAQEGILPLPYVASAWAVVAILLAALLGRHFPSAYPAVLVSLLLAWWMLDARWTANRLAQAAETVQAYPMVHARHLEFGDDGDILQLIDEMRDLIARPGKRTLILAEDSAMEFETLRAKYHALPAATFIHRGQMWSAPLTSADYLLVMRKRYADIDHRPVRPHRYANRIESYTGITATIARVSENGFLLALSPKDPLTGAPESSNNE